MKGFMCELKNNVRAFKKTSVPKTFVIKTSGFSLSSPDLDARTKHFLERMSILVTLLISTAKDFVFFLPSLPP